MSRSRQARNALIKCVPCGAPAILTADSRCICVECGRELCSGSVTITATDPRYPPEGTE